MQGQTESIFSKQDTGMLICLYGDCLTFPRTSSQVMLSKTVVAYFFRETISVLLISKPSPSSSSFLSFLEVPGGFLTADPIAESLVGPSLAR